MTVPTRLMAQGEAVLVERQTQTIEAELFNRWINYIGDKAPKTVETYTRCIKQFLMYLTEYGIKHPQRDDIIAYKKTLSLKHTLATVQAYLVAVSLFFRWTSSEGLYPNIAERVTAVRVDKFHKRDYLSIEEVKLLLSTIDRSNEQGQRNYAIIICMLVGGLRDIEVASADVGDVQRRCGGDVLYIKGKGHTEKTDYIKLPIQLKQAVSAYIETRTRNAIIPIRNEDPLFASTAHRNSGERLTTRSISRIAKNALIAADMRSPRLTAHSLRHTCAVLNLLNGASLVDTQILLRHTSSDTTRIYSHDIERETNNSEARIATAIFG